MDQGSTTQTPGKNLPVRPGAEARCCRIPPLVDQHSPARGRPRGRASPPPSPRQRKREGERESLRDGAIAVIAGCCAVALLRRLRIGCIARAMIGPGTARLRNCATAGPVARRTHRRCDQGRIARRRILPSGLAGPDAGPASSCGYGVTRKSRAPSVETRTGPDAGCLRVTGSRARPVASSWATGFPSTLASPSLARSVWNPTPPVA